MYGHRGPVGTLVRTRTPAQPAATVQWSFPRLPSYVRPRLAGAQACRLRHTRPRSQQCSASPGSAWTTRSPRCWGVPDGNDRGRSRTAQWRVDDRSAVDSRDVARLACGGVAAEARLAASWSSGKPRGFGSPPMTRTRVGSPRDRVVERPSEPAYEVLSTSLTRVPGAPGRRRSLRRTGTFCTGPSNRRHSLALATR